MRHTQLLALAAMAGMIGPAAVDQHVVTGRPFPTKVDHDDPPGKGRKKKRGKYRYRIGNQNDRKDKTHRLKGLRP